MNIQTKHNIGDTVAFIPFNSIIEGEIMGILAYSSEILYDIEGHHTPIDEVFDSKVEAAHHWLTSNGIEIDSEVHNIKCKISTILKEMENTND
jgi:hypothetical protein